MGEPTVGVIAASLGRAEALGHLLAHLRGQTRPVDRLVVSVVSSDDLPPADLLADADVVMGSKGLTAQRNRGLDRLRGAVDVIAFFDDDWVPSRRTIERLAQVFALWPDVAGVCGRVLADGVTGPGISYDEAVALVERFDAEPVLPPRILCETPGLTGHNMAYRASALGGARFDENLPLYGWQEDVDFTGQILRHGRAIQTDAIAGVHRGVKGGRISGLRFGYSQIANPIYIARKGTMPWRRALALMGRNIAANHARALWPEPWVDRRGRVVGNWRAFGDLVRGRMHPSKILEM